MRHLDAPAAALLLLGALFGCDALSGEPAAPTWSTDTAQVYALDLKSWVELSSGSGQRLGQIELSGKLELTPLEVGEQRVRLGALLTDAKFSGPGASSPALVESAQQLARPFTISLERGALTGNQVDPELSAVSTSVLRTISAALQFAPAPDAEPSWNAAEHDATGSYRVQYRRAEPHAFTRTKLAYTHVSQSVAPDAKPARLDAKIERSEGRVKLQDGRLAAVSGSDLLSLPFGKSSRLRSHTQLRLRGVATRPAQAAEAAQRFATATRQLRIEEALTADETDRGKFDQQRIGSETFDSVVAALELDATKDRDAKPVAPAAGADEKSAAEASLDAHTRAFSALSAILRQSPESVARALALVHGDSPAAREILSALSVAGTPTAQQALVRVLGDDSVKEHLRWQACFALSRTPLASEAAVTALGAVLDHPRLGTQAVYGLGTIARRLSEAGQAQRGKRIVEQLVARLSKQTASEAKVIVLRALGNAGDAAALPVARPLLSDPDRELRAAAADALRLIRLPEVDVLLARQLEQESTSVVRVAILGSIASRAPQKSLIEAVERTAIEAADLASRARAVRVLDKWAPDAPQVRPVLAQVAAKDASEEIRKLASASLTRME